MRTGGTILPVRTDLNNELQRLVKTTRRFDCFRILRSEK